MSGIQIASFISKLLEEGHAHERWKEIKKSNIFRKVSPPPAPPLSKYFLAQHQGHFSNLSAVLTVWGGPDKLEVSKCDAVYKKGQKKNLDNYSPVSLTWVPRKAMEQIILSAIMWHIQDNQGIRLSQLACLNGRSCLANSVSFHDKVTHFMDEGRAVIVVYLDKSVILWWGVLLSLALLYAIINLQYSLLLLKKTELETPHS